MSGAFAHGIFGVAGLTRVIIFILRNITTAAIAAKAIFLGDNIFIHKNCVDIFIISII